MDDWNDVFVCGFMYGRIDGWVSGVLDRLDGRMYERMGGYEPQRALFDSVALPLTSARVCPTGGHVVEARKPTRNRSRQLDHSIPSIQPWVEAPKGYVRVGSGLHQPLHSR